MRVPLFALAAFFCVGLMSAREIKLSCGTYADKWREELQLHRRAERLGAGKRVRDSRAAFAAGESLVDGKRVRADAGQIAILDDADGVVSRRNPFSLNRRTVRFIPVAPGRYRYETAESTWDAAVATAGSRLADLGDDDSREVQLPFAFPFFATQYRALFVNSDGNVTFGAGDAAITDRSLGRFTSGAPRLAPMFRDLDPTRTRGVGGIYTASAGNAFVISWHEVPEYRDTGTGPVQSFQLRLFPDGRIEFAYGDTSTSEAVTGISPGRLQGSAAVVSFVNTPSGDYNSTIAERFTNNELIDIFSAAQKFYLNHEDSYDYLVFYNNLGIEADAGAVAYEVTVRNNRSGYGDEPVDIGAEAGSRRRLQALLNMGPLNQYPQDPDARVPARQSVGDTPLTTIAHETGHLFLAYASVRDEQSSTPMLGYQTAHWGFTFNSDASLLEGNRIQDNGPGASPRFLTTGAVEGFSALDQYLMGLRAPEEVPDTFYVANARGSRVSGLPRVGVTFDGDRRDVRIDQIIEATGRRTPDHNVSQRQFRFAFVLITAAGSEPTVAELAQLETWRGRYEQFFAKATSGRAAADATVRRALHVSTFPAAGVAAGATGTATISVESPLATPLTVVLRSRAGNVQTPASVTIPAGATQVSWIFTGVRAGVDEVTAESADSAFTPVISKIQVSTPESIRLRIAGGDAQTATPGVPLTQPIRVRVTDINNLPYPGLTLRTSLTGGGTVDRPSATTDSNGEASFLWTPGSESINELRAEIAGGASVVATAAGKPSLSGAAVVNAASFVPGLTPGGLATAFGANLNGTLSVLLNGASVPVLYSGTRQVNFQVPASIQSGTAEVVVRTGVGVTEAVRVPVQTVQPGIFFDGGTGYGAVLIAGTAQTTNVRPARRGEVVEIYATGLGAVGAGQMTSAQTAVTVGTVSAEILYSGLAPGFPGLYQINARIPEIVATGTQPLALTAAGIRSNEVRVEIR